jgi:hypothetical protein
MTVRMRRDVLAVVMEDAGMDPDTDLREGYGGRAMYGGETFGLVVGSDNSFFMFLVELAKTEGVDGDTAQELAQRARSDSMGKNSSIFYFPGVELVDGD